MNAKLATKILIVLIALSLALTACAGRPSLPLEMIVAMNAYADQSDIDHPDFTDINIARACVQEPIALYWSDTSKMWQVVCELDIPSYSTVYGVVLIDSLSYSVIFAGNVNAKSLSGLEEIIAGDGWVRQ